MHKWSGFYWDHKLLKLTPADLGEETRFLFLGQFAKGLGKIYNVPVWGSPWSRHLMKKREEDDVKI